MFEIDRMILTCLETNIFVTDVDFLHVEIFTFFISLFKEIRKKREREIERER